MNYHDIRKALPVVDGFARAALKAASDERRCAAQEALRILKQAEEAVDLGNEELAGNMLCCATGMVMSPHGLDASKAWWIFPPASDNTQTAQPDTAESRAECAVIAMADAISAH